MVGIIGAGQLARMTAQAAISLAVDTKVLAVLPTDPACVAATAVEIGDPNDPAALQRFVAGCDVVTFDHERVDPTLLARIETEGVRVRPSAAVLHFSDKAHQRVELAAHGFPVPPFDVVTTASEVVAFAAAHDWPVVAKTAVGGYDGRGVFVLENRDQAVATIGGLAGRRVVVEPMLDISAEIAVLVARRPSGDSAVYPMVETIQHDGICLETIAPATIDPDLRTQARNIAESIAETIGSVGILAVEFFITPDGVIVNELAPRPHNSGHWTIEGAITSQFENHVRGILDWPLGDTSLAAPAVAMANILGGAPSARPDDLPGALSVSGAHVHLYAKPTRPGRKLGHITATGPDQTVALHRARTALAAFTGTPMSKGTLHDH